MSIDLGRSASKQRALEAINQWPELEHLDKYTKGGLASMIVARVLDADSGYNTEVASKMRPVEEEAQESAWKNRPFGGPNDDGTFVITSNARSLAHDILRAAIKAGVVAADDDVMAYLALCGSAGHDDTVASMKKEIESNVQNEQAE